MTAAPIPAADITVDGTGLLCVTLLLRLRDRIQDAQPGAVVHVIAADPAAPLDLPAWCHMTGHTYLGPTSGHDEPGVRTATGRRRPPHPRRRTVAPGSKGPLTRLRHGPHGDRP